MKALLLMVRTLLFRVVPPVAFAGAGMYVLAAVLPAAPAFAQSNGWQEIQNGWGEVQTVPGYSVMPAPTGCISTSVPFFGTSVTLGCDAGLSYDAATDTLAVGGLKPSGQAVIYGDATAGLVATLSGVSITTRDTTNGVTWLTKSGHGLTLRQSDIVVITSATTAENRGVYYLTGYDSNRLEISGLLNGSDTDIVLSIYRNVSAQGTNGRWLNHATLTGTGLEIAEGLVYYVDRSSGHSRGLQIRFTAPNIGTTHYPFHIYRGLWADLPLFAVDAEGDTTTLGKATESATETKSLVVTKLAAPTLTCITYATGGSTSWGYKVAAVDAQGNEGPLSSECVVANGPATLSYYPDHTRITWPAVPGGYTYNVYRTTSGGTPATTGKVSTASYPGPKYLFDDTGYAASGSPTGDKSGTGSFERAVTIGGFQKIPFTKVIADATSTPIFEIAMGANDAVQFSLGMEAGFTVTNGTVQQAASWWMRGAAASQTSTTPVCVLGTGDPTSTLANSSGAAYANTTTTCAGATGKVTVSLAVDSGLTGTPVITVSGILTVLGSHAVTLK